MFLLVKYIEELDYLLHVFLWRLAPHLCDEGSSEFLLSISCLKKSKSIRNLQSVTHKHLELTQLYSGIKENLLIEL